MTRPAQLNLRGFLQLRLLRLRIVHAVTGDAREVARIMRTALPLRMLAAVVARRADLTHLALRHLWKHTDLRNVAVRVHMRLPWTVAGFAAHPGHRRARVDGTGVLGMAQARTLGVVTRHARVGPDIAWRRSLCLHRSPKRRSWLRWQKIRGRKNGAGT